MRIRAVEISVGVFLLLGIVALLLLALRVSGLTVASSTDTCKLTAHFDNIAGLTTRAKVTMAGVAVGKVVSIDFDTETYTGKVVMEVQRQVNNLPTDTTASILTAGLALAVKKMS